MISQDIRNTVNGVAVLIEDETLTRESLVQALRDILTYADDVANLEAQPVPIPNPAAMRKVQVTCLSPGVPACARRVGQVIRPPEDIWKGKRS